MNRALIRTMGRQALALALFAMVTGGLIALTHSLTGEPIRERQAEARAAALQAVLPDRLRGPDVEARPFQLTDREALDLESEAAKGYRILQDESVEAVVLPTVAPDGYSGPIHLLVGIAPDGTLLGVRVTRHQETPGLGDRVERQKSDWVEHFQGRSLDDPEPSGWHVQKRGGVFDQFTGATITPQAVTRAVYQSLTYFRQHRKWLLTHPSPAIEPGNL